MKNDRIGGNDVTGRLSALDDEGEFGAIRSYAELSTAGGGSQRRTSLPAGIDVTEDEGRVTVGIDVPEATDSRRRCEISGSKAPPGSQTGTGGEMNLLPLAFVEQVTLTAETGCLRHTVRSKLPIQNRTNLL